MSLSYRILYLDGDLVGSGAGGGSGGKLLNFLSSRPTTSLSRSLLCPPSSFSGVFRASSPDIDFGGLYVPFSQGYLFSSACSSNRNCWMRFLVSLLAYLIFKRRWIA